MKDSRQSLRAEAVTSVLIDTNVFLDVLIDREDKSLQENSAELIDFASYSRRFRFYVSTLSLGTVFFYLRKLPKSQKKEILDCILKGVEVVDTRREAYDYVWESGFTDLEDAMQEHCAVASACPCIVTNNIRDYGTSKLEILSPKEFLEKYTYV